MTEGTVDVNERLFRERRGVVESGQVGRGDDGSWVYADKSEVFGRDGLDMSTGQAALYTTTPAWHGLGTVIPGGIADIEEVLSLARIDFDVELRPAMFEDNDGRPREIEGQFVTVRTDTDAPLGIVGSRYRPNHPRRAFEFLQELTERFDIPWESAGALRGGRKIFVSMRLPDTVRIESEHVQDEIVPFLAVMDSYDGSSPFRAVATPWRPVCANTERFAVRDAYTSWSVRHTEGATARFEEARRALKLSLSYYEQLAAEETALARVDLAIDDFRQVVDDLWPVDADASKRTQGNAERRREKLTELFTSSPTTANCRGTAYGAERAITEYADWHAQIRPPKSMTEDIARATAAMEGANDDIKSRAHKRLMVLTH